MSGEEPTNENDENKKESEETSDPNKSPTKKSGGMGSFIISLLVPLFAFYLHCFLNSHHGKNLHAILPTGQKACSVPHQSRDLKNCAPQSHYVALRHDAAVNCEAQGRDIGNREGQSLARHHACQVRSWPAQKRK